MIVLNKLSLPDLISTTFSCHVMARILSVMGCFVKIALSDFTAATVRNILAHEII